MNDKEKLQNLRHTSSHLLAAAVMELYSDAKRTLGPAIENGFYYDFDFTEAVSENDLAKIEDKMHELLPKWTEFTHKTVSADEAKQMFAGNEYKHELIDDFASKGEDLTVYECGGFVDLCKGGHVDNPAEEIGAFKLMSVAGAYWRGDENNKMLTRIYGTAFSTQKELDDYLLMLEESKKRDHKLLGKTLDLFTFSDMVGGGLPLWTPKGTLMRNLLDDFVWELRSAKGFEKVEIPHVAKRELYETSGHWTKFADELFHITTREEHEFVMKPMNCPHHTQIFARFPHSYRDMPQRFANTTMVYRDEQSGELSGLSRVRSITQDDAHVFCREEQVHDEVVAIWSIIKDFYKGVGFEDLTISLSMHDPDNMEAYLGTEEQWQYSEGQLRDILEQEGAEFFEAPGEAAFYGPKIDFIGRDSLGREWQVATIQLDRFMPNRFGLHCINEEGEKEQIVMIHCAIMGSIERFMSVMIEHFGGAFPVWLSPVQVVVIPISEKHVDYADDTAAHLTEAGVRVEVDDKDETMGNKIRKAQELKVPYMLVVGDKEMENNTINVRTRDGDQRGEMDIDSFTNEIASKIVQKLLDL
ncbi:threonine--tRNA ligase [candidate division WWE3 bacterium]|uniref:Threonine--tRNA ligase n=1 Tax=candidate division WWE3 bacterium TaxID=2053526 RepID=A0A955RQN5_UNCKA|nr:threonine--tRNA ligase [candidate division WWE3 bacterium]